MEDLYGFKYILVKIVSNTEKKTIWKGDRRKR